MWHPLDIVDVHLNLKKEEKKNKAFHFKENIYILCFFKESKAFHFKQERKLFVDVMKRSEALQYPSY